MSTWFKSASWNASNAVMFFVLVPLWLVAKHCIADSPQSPVPQKIALLVGVADYFDKNMEDLDYAENDVVAVGAELSRLGFETTVLTGKEASSVQIHGALENLFAKTATLESDAIVFLMLSGHGQQLKTADPSGSLIEAPYFCPRDAVPFDPANHSLRGKTTDQIANELKLISLNQVIASLGQKSNSMRNLLVIDACRNNPAKGKSAGITGSTAINLPQGISMLFAAKSGQRSWESIDPKRPHGVMSYYLLRGLRGQASNSRQQITWSRLVNYIREEVEFDAGKLAGGIDRRQSPHAILNEDEVIVLSAPPEANSQWNRFRGPNGSGINANAKVPRQWSESKNVRWKLKMPGKGESSPIVFDRKVLLTSFTSDAEDNKKNVRRQVLCVDVNDGRTLWKFETEPKTEPAGPWRTGEGGFASNTLTADELGVYGWFGESGLIAIDWNGNELWRYQIPQEKLTKRSPWTSGSSPILYDGKVVFNTNSVSEQIIAIDQRTGRLIWSVEDPSLNNAHQTPVIYRDDAAEELIVCSKERLSAYGPSTGSRLWHIELGNMAPYHQGGPLHRDGVVFGFGQNRTVAVRGRGTQDIEDTANHIWTSSFSNRDLNTPVLFRNQLVACGGRILSVIDTESGEELRRERIFGRERFGASPVVAGTDVLFLDQRGTTYIVDPLASWTLVATNTIAEEEPHFFATPAVLDDCLLIRSNECLYCIGE